MMANAWLIAWILGSLASVTFDSAFKLEQALATLSWAHPLGCDAFGRDLVALVLSASLRSSAFAAAATAASILIALILGSGIAVLPRYARALSLRALDLAVAFPSLLLALSYASIRGPGADTLFFSLLAGLLPTLTRSLWARASEVAAEDFVMASYSLGASRFRIAAKHLLPALSSLCRLKAPSLFAHALLAEATLSYLGVGASIGTDTWGSLLLQGKDYLFEAPHIALAAGVPLVFTVASLQSKSDA